MSMVFEDFAMRVARPPVAMILDIFLIQFLFDAVHDLIDLSDETVIDPCLHRGNGIAANDARRLDQLDARKLRSSLEKSFHGDPDARCDSTAQIVALGI